jgi:hypothetical protein
VGDEHDDRVGPRSWYWPTRYKILLAVVIAAVLVLVLILVNPGPGSDYR